MKVSAVIVSHQQPDEVERCVAALAGEVDDIIVVANTPTSARELPPEVHRVESPVPRGFSANANAGIRVATGDAVLVVNPDTAARPGAVGHLVAFMETHPRCGVAGPGSSIRTAAGSRLAGRSRRFGERS